MIYLDTFDIEKLYGTGGTPFVKLLLKYHKEKITFVGVTSGNNTPGIALKKEIEGREIMFIPILKSDFRFRLYKLPESIRFFIALVKYYRLILKFNDRNLIIRSYAVLWFFVLWHKGWRVIYYAPGLGNPMLIGRRPLIGRLLSSLYLYVHSKALDKTDVLLAAASRKEIGQYNSWLFNKRSKKLFEYLPEGVDHELFVPVNKELARSELGINEHFVFSFIGRLALVKRVTFLVEAFRLFNLDHPDSLFIIAGDGEEKEIIKEQIRKLSLEDCIILKGLMRPEQVRTIIGASDAALFASKTEGFSIAMLEILSCGRPILTTKVSGTDEMIIDGVTGFVVDELDPCSYAQKMSEVVKISNVEANCRDHVVDNFTEKIQWERLKGFIDRL